MVLTSSPLNARKESRVNVNKRITFKENGMGGMELPAAHGGGPDASEGQTNLSSTKGKPTSQPHWSGLEDEEMEEIEKQESKEATNRKGKTLGLPEIDPDALPSSLAQKYLSLSSKQPCQLENNIQQIRCW